MVNYTRHLTTVLVVCLFTSAVLTASCSPSTGTEVRWHIETVASGGAGAYTSLALDSNNNPHISHYSNTLMYSYREGNTWRTIEVDKIKGNGSYCSLALDSQDNPHISYFSAGTTALKYARFTGSSWKIETVGGAISNLGIWTSIAIDGNDNPHISYATLAYDGTTTLKYASYDGSSWQTEIIDPTPGCGQFNSLAIDSNNKPHISYYGNGELKYARWTGSNWQITAVDSEKIVGEYTSIALDNNDNPHISYYDRTHAALKYAYWTGTAWAIQIVDSNGYVGQWSSLALDSGNNPHISYYVSYYGTNNSDPKYAYWNGSSWNISTVDSKGTAAEYTSIALDSNNNPYISYQLSNESLKYASLIKR